MVLQGAGMSCLGDDEVTGLLAGALGADAFAQAENHLDACRRCRLLVSTLAARTGDQFRDGCLSSFGPGDVVAGRYRIVSLLGSGGMGEVYETLDTMLGETVALKTLAPGMPLDELGVARFKAEVQVARRVTHRNVCRVFDVGFHSDERGAQAQDRDQVASLAIPFFTMELLAGETLRKRLQRTGPLSGAEVLPLLEEMAAGLDAAHAAGVIHRDFKSENVMLVPEERETRVVITDFGLAHQLDGQAFRQRPSIMDAAGTLGYMAPEQLAGERPRHTADIYALGVVLFELLTGELPFRIADIVAAKGQAAGRPPPNLGSLPDVPPGWEAAIARCLEVSPSARFESVHDVLSALRAPFAPSRRRGLHGKVSMGVAMTALVAAASVAFAHWTPTAAIVARPPIERPESPSLLRAETGLSAAPTSPAISPSTSPLPRRARPSARSVAKRHAVTAAPPLNAVRATEPLGNDDFVNPFEIQ